VSATQGFATQDKAHSAGAAAFRQLSQEGRNPIGWAVVKVKRGKGFYVNIGCAGGPVQVWPQPAEAPAT
jgi:hypothetical protein